MPRSSRRTPKARAFTRVELLALLAVLALLSLVVVPALANNRPRSQRVICANNLRQIGTAMQLWGNDHNELLPQEVAVADGGTRLHPLAANVWLHFAWLSNELGSAKALLCPSDTGQPARDFTGDPTGGYIHPNFANRATSYLLGYRLYYDSLATDATIAGDRNVSTYSVQACSRFNSALSIPTPPPPGTAQWTRGLHGSAGNLLRSDGRVEQLENAGLRRALDLPFTDNVTRHIITPR